MGVLTMGRRLGIAAPWSRFVEYTTPGSYTFTVPPGVFKVWVTLVGGGGGGGGSYYNGIYSSGTGAGSGGGGAETLLDYPMAVVPGQQIAVTVGSGGIGDRYSYGNYTQGTSATASVFGSISALPGTKGHSGVYSSSGYAGWGARGGSATGNGGTGGYRQRYTEPDYSLQNVMSTVAMTSNEVTLNASDSEFPYYQAFYYENGVYPVGTAYRLRDSDTYGTYVTSQGSEFTIGYDLGKWISFKGVTLYKATGQTDAESPDNFYLYDDAGNLLGSLLNSAWTGSTVKNIYISNPVRLRKFKLKVACSNGTPPKAAHIDVYLDGNTVVIAEPDRLMSIYQTRRHTTLRHRRSPVVRPVSVNRFAGYSGCGGAAGTWCGLGKATGNGGGVYAAGGTSGATGSNTGGGGGASLLGAGGPGGFVSSTSAPPASLAGGYPGGGGGGNGYGNMNYGGKGGDGYVKVRY